MLSVTFAVWTKLPQVAVTIRTEVPLTAADPAEIVSVAEPGMGLVDGANAAVTPTGRPLTVSIAGSTPKPFEVRLIATVPVRVGATSRLLGLSASEKSWVEAEYTAIVTGTE
jgi:hypothetical protein